MRGFACVSDFCRVLRANDLRAAKTSFIPTFIDELKDKSGPEVPHLIEEAENLLVDRQGWVMIGVVPTGGQFNDMPHGLMRLQPGYASARMSRVLVQTSRYLVDTHQVFQDRVRHPQGGEQGGDKGKRKGKGNGPVGRGRGGRERNQRWPDTTGSCRLSADSFRPFSWSLPSPYPHSCYVLCFDVTSCVSFGICVFFFKLGLFSGPFSGWCLALS